MTIKQLTKQEALDRLVEQEIEKQNRIDEANRQREAEAEAEAKRLAEAQALYDAEIDQLRKQLADITSRQSAWRDRFVKLTEEIEQMSDDQSEIQTEIQSAIAAVKEAVHLGRTNGALVPVEQMAWDGIGGDSQELRPFPRNVSNNKYMPSNFRNDLALLCYPKQQLYRVDRMLNGRRRV